MSNLDFIEAASGGPFVVRHNGDDLVLDDPVDMPYQAILAFLQEQHAPGLSARMPEWKRSLTFNRWSAHYDLPDFQSAQRLCYLLDRYRSALVYDIAHFCPGVDIGDLWRSRRWRTALDLIDHLPGHSWYSSAVSGDEEHAAMIAESLAMRESEGEKAPAGPALHTWTPEVALLTALRDDVRALHYIIPASQGDKKAKPPPPLPRPTTPLEAAVHRASFEHRKAKHEDLVKRLLPHKR